MQPTNNITCARRASEPWIPTNFLDLELTLLSTRSSFTAKAALKMT